MCRILFCVAGKGRPENQVAARAMASPSKLRRYSARTRIFSSLRASAAMREQVWEKVKNESVAACGKGFAAGWKVAGSGGFSSGGLDFECSSRDSECCADLDTDKRKLWAGLVNVSYESTNWARREYASSASRNRKTRSQTGRSALLFRYRLTVADAGAQGNKTLN